MPQRTSLSRSRSRSPSHHRHHHHRHRTDDSSRHRDRDNDRERSHRHRHRHRHDRQKHSASSAGAQDTPQQPQQPIVLPYQARELHKRDLEQFFPMFAMYLDIQKGIFVEDLSEDEVKGRWKSFTGKWNRGELAEGWYDPATFEKAQDGFTGSATAKISERLSPDNGRRSESNEKMNDRQDQHLQEGATRTGEANEDEEEEEEEEEEHGPVLPHASLSSKPSGPTIPTIQDIKLRNESAIEDTIAERQGFRDQRRAEVRSHRSELRHMEDEVAPRAEPGTHERRMEKRRETAAANRAFAESRRGGSPTDAAPDDELMGSGENDLDAIRSAKEKERRRKNEREIRREEILRARAAEREERLQRYRAKEEETIGWLKNLAQQRFG